MKATDKKLKEIQKLMALCITSIAQAMTNENAGDHLPKALILMAQALHQLDLHQRRTFQAAIKLMKIINKYVKPTVLAY